MQCEQHGVAAKDEGPPCGCHEADLLPLVEIMLGVLQHCQDAVLQDSAESLAVIRGVLGNLCRGGGPGDAVSGERLVQGLGRLFERVLQSPDAPFARATLMPGNSGQLSEGSVAPRCWERLTDHERLADWFGALTMHLRRVHPRAVEMLRLRFSGLGTREIAERLEMPTRLVRQVLGDVCGTSLDAEA